MIWKSIYIDVHFNIGVPLLAEDTKLSLQVTVLNDASKENPCQPNPSKLYKTRYMFHHRKFGEFWSGFNQFQLILNFWTSNLLLSVNFPTFVVVKLYEIPEIPISPMFPAGEFAGRRCGGHLMQWKRHPIDSWNLYKIYPNLSGRSQYNQYRYTIIYIIVPW